MLPKRKDASHLIFQAEFPDFSCKWYVFGKQRPARIHKSIKKKFTCGFVRWCRIVYDHHIVLVHVLFAIRAGVGLFCFLSRESNAEQATPLTGCLPCFAGFRFGVSGLFAVKAVQLYRRNATVVSTDQRFQTIRLKTTEHFIHCYTLSSVIMYYNKYKHSLAVIT